MTTSATGSIQNWFLLYFLTARASAVSAQSCNIIASPGFPQPIFFLTSAPTDLGLGDLNGDQWPDIITANRTNSVSLLLNAKLNVTFSAAINHSVGNMPLSLVISDIDSDSHVDILTCNYASEDISLLHNVGNATLQPDRRIFIANKTPNEEAPSGPTDMVVADINSDSLLDIATLLPERHLISIISALGHAEFDTPNSIFFRERGQLSLTATDYDLDGDIDLQTLRFEDGDPPTGYVVVCVNESDGSFRLIQTAISFPIALKRTRSIAEDFDQDGLFDLCIVNETDVSLMFGNGDGSFAEALTLQTDGIGIDVAASDLDGDNDLDLGVAGSQAIAVLYNRGNREFSPGLSHFTAIDSTSILFSDLDTDGIVDIVTANRVCTTEAEACKGDVSIFRGSGGRELFGTMLSAIDANGDATSLIAADIDGDGRTDLLHTNNLLQEILPHLNVDGKSFLTTDAIATRGQARFLKGTDINLDQFTDIVVASGISSLFVYHGRGDGTFLQDCLHLNFDAIPSQVQPADINGDDFPDLVVSFTGGNAASKRIGILVNSGRATFEEYHSVPVGRAQSDIVLGDLNLDGLTDIIAISDDSKELVTGFATSPTAFVISQVLVLEDSPLSVATADLNSDGYEDIIVSEASSRVTTFCAKMDGHLSFVDTTTVAAYPLSIVTFDFNYDTLIDVAVAGFEGNGISILAGKGDGALSAPQTFRAGNGPLALAVLDINGDSLDDLACVNTTAQTITLHLNQLGMDCNFNSIIDDCDLSLGNSKDTNRDSIPDECQKPKPRFVRGDCAGNGTTTDMVTDALVLLQYSFLGASEPPCLAACDVDGDGRVVGISDAIFGLRYAFSAGSPSPRPFPFCGSGKLQDYQILGCAKGPSECHN